MVTNIGKRPRLIPEKAVGHGDTASTVENLACKAVRHPLDW
jgi:hypothetical protein